MTDETTIISKPVSPDSTIGKVSVRAWLALIAVMGVVYTHVAVTTAVIIHACITKDFNMVGTLTTITEPLYSLAVGAVAYYFGQNSKK